MDIQIFAKTPTNPNNQLFHWVRISPDSQGTGGVFVLLNDDLSQKSLFDYWFENIDIAKKWANRNFGISNDDWKTKEDLQQEGFEVIDEK